LQDVEIIGRVERRRKWSPEEKAALLAEVEAEGGRVKLVARRHRISESLLYNWRSAWKMAVSLRESPGVEFIPIGMIDHQADDAAPPALAAPEQPAESPAGSEARAGGIDIDLPNGARIRVDAFVNETALARVLRAMKGSM
jgi:transposase-like protein